MPPQRRQKDLEHSPSVMAPSAAMATRKVLRRRLPDPYSLVPPGRGHYSGIVTFRAAMRWMLLRITIILVSKEHRLQDQPYEVVCPACAHSYVNQIYELVRHIFAHLPEEFRPLPCSLPAYLNDGCQRRFSEASGRAIHEATHFRAKGLPLPEERKTPCGVSVHGILCSETFNSPYAAYRHRVKQHASAGHARRTRSRTGTRGTAEDSIKVLYRYWEQGGWREAFDGNLRDGYGPLGIGDVDLPNDVLGSQHIMRFVCSPDHASESDAMAPLGGGHGESDHGSLHGTLALVADSTDANDMGSPPERPGSTPPLQSPATDLSLESTTTTSLSRSTPHESSSSSYPPSTPSLSNSPSRPSRALEPIAGLPDDLRVVEAVVCHYDTSKCPWPPRPRSPLPATLARTDTVRFVPMPPWEVQPQTQTRENARILDEPSESSFERDPAAEEAQLEAVLNMMRRQRERPAVYKPAFSFA